MDSAARSQPTKDNSPMSTSTSPTLDARRLALASAEFISAGAVFIHAIHHPDTPHKILRIGEALGSVEVYANAVREIIGGSPLGENPQKNLDFSTALSLMKTGKRLRRAGGEGFLKISAPEKDEPCFEDQDGFLHELGTEDLLATDWEIVE